MSSQKEDSSLSAEQIAQVDDYLEQFMVRDGDGVLADVKCSHSELQNFLNRYHPPTLQGFSPLDSALNTSSFRKAVRERFRSQLTISMRLGSDKRYKECKNQLSPIDQLKQLALDWEQHPAEAVVVAKMYLYGWFCTPRDADYARYLLERVADVCGEPSAAALLAKVRIPSEPITPFDTRGAQQGPFLIDSRIFRDRFHRKAREASPAYRRWEEGNNELAADSYHAELNTELLPDAEEHLKHAEHLAQSGKSDHMYWAGEAALELLGLLDQVCDRDSDTLKFYWEKARDWFFKAQSLDARARTVISERFEHDDEKAFDLLVSAAFPEDGVEWDPNALSPLARRFYLNAESTHFNAEVGERCLHLYHDVFPIKESDGHVPTVTGDVETAIFFADYLRTKSDSDAADLSVAFKVYQASASNSAYAALRAGLMALRGEGCVANNEQAKQFLNLAHKNPTSRRDARAADYAEALLQIGWLNLTHLQEATFKLVQVADDLGFDNDPTCSVLGSDVDLLIAQNQLRQQTSKLAGDTWVKRWALANLRIQLICQALRSDAVLDPNVFESLCRTNDALILYVTGRLWLVGKFGQVDNDKAETHLNKAIDEAKAWLIVESNPEKKGAAHWLLDHAQRHLLEVKNQNLEQLNKELKNTQAELEDMMAMFAHKFRGPVDSIISNAEHPLANRDHLFKDLGRTMNGLLDIFSFVSSHSEKLVPRLQEDNDGPHTLTHVLHKALWLTVVQLLTKRNIDRMNKHYFMYALREGRIPAATTFSEWRKQKPMRDVREAIRTTWEMDIGAYGDFADLDGLLAWLSSKLMRIQVEGISAQDVRFADSGVKESLLLVILTEILVNAIKHYEPSSALPILIRWTMDEDKAVFSCENPTSELARKRGEGSGRGLKFLSMIARNVGGEFYPPSETDNALAEFSFPIKLFK